MSSELDLERINKIHLLVSDICNFPAYFCPLFEIHDRTFAFLTQLQLIDHMANHTDGELERYINYNHSLKSDLSVDEEEQEETYLEYYVNIPLNILAPITYNSDRALGVFDYRVSKELELTPEEVYNTLTDKEKDDLKAHLTGKEDLNEFMSDEESTASDEKEPLEGVKVSSSIDDDAVFNGFELVHKDTIGNAEDQPNEKTLKEELEREQIEEHIQDGLSDMHEYIDGETEEEQELSMDLKEALDVHLPDNLEEEQEE